VVVGVDDSPIWVGDGQELGGGLAGNPVPGMTKGVEVGNLVDERSGLGIGTGLGGPPEARADVDRSELGGI
jgi:hypothetical protein